MGRPYAMEVARLPDTYAFAASCDIAGIRIALDEILRWPLLVVGSGGSVSACELAARLHATYSGLSASVLTPLEFLRRPLAEGTAVLLLSASGRNPDILAAADHAIRAECQAVAALTTSPSSPLARQLRRARHAHALEVPGPARRDGFLATNSLLLTGALLIRGYAVPLPPMLPSLDRGMQDPINPALIHTLLVKPHVIALASAWAFPAALDLESKWGESGIGQVTVLDPRNFAHGRHTGLMRRTHDTTVMGITAGEDAIVAETVEALPDEIDYQGLCSPLNGAVGALDLIARVIRLTGSVSSELHLDPGRPRVPVFGRRLFHAGIRRAVAARPLRPLDIWIKRKVTAPVWESSTEETRKEWRKIGQAWQQRLRSVSFGAIVFDYDGTLCEESERRTAPHDAVTQLLIAFLRGGLKLGIATGRGGSVIESLRPTLPEDVWDGIAIGMYNGALLCRFHSPLPETDPPAMSTALSMAAERLRSCAVLSSVAEIRTRDRQITITERRPIPAGLLWRVVHECVGSQLNRELSVVTSGRTVDVLDGASSKALLVDDIRASLPTGLEVLTIGDQGQYPGNDFSLLAHPFGLSVDRASTNFDGCWNIAPVGAKRTDALIAYLDAVNIVGPGAAVLDVDKLLATPRRRKTIRV